VAPYVPTSKRLIEIEAEVPGLGARANLRLRSKFNVLYGINGVGKSRILSGIGSSATFVFRVPLRDDGPSHLGRHFWPQIDFNFWSQSALLEPGTGPLYRKYLKSEDQFSLEDEADVINSILADRSFLDGFDDLDTEYGSWLLHLCYWVGGYPDLPEEDRRLLKAAMQEVLEQGRISVEPAVGPQFPDGGWLYSYFVALNPDDSPAVMNYAKKMAKQIVDHHQGEFELVAQDSRAKMVRNALSTFEDLFNLLELRPFAFAEAVAHEVVDEICGREFGWENVPERPFGLEGLVAQRISADAPVVVLSADRDGIIGPAETLEEHYYIANPFVSLTELSTQAQHAITQIESEVNEIASLLLPDAPKIRASRNPWKHLPQLDWQAEDKSGRWVDIQDLSDTQRRLVTLAISITHRIFITGGDQAAILLFDEPERGLHRLAEKHLRRGLERLSEIYSDLVVVVASHSPVFLQPGGAGLHHILRNAYGDLEVHPLDTKRHDDPKSLGIPTSELLQFVQVVVLVEGQHDYWVFTKLFEDEFTDLGVEVIPLRGAQKLVSVADAHLLFYYSEAKLVVVLDATDQKRVEKYWHEALEIKRAGKPIEDAFAALDKIPPKANKNKHELNPTLEYRSLVTFCQEAIKKDREDRVTLSMLELLDIEDYLDPKHFLTSGDSPSEQVTWSDLRKQHQAALQSGERGNFKDWLASTGRASFDEARWDAALEDLDAVPPDLAAVLNRVRHAASKVDS